MRTDGSPWSHCNFLDTCRIASGRRWPPPVSAWSSRAMPTRSMHRCGMRRSPFSLAMRTPVALMRGIFAGSTADTRDSMATCHEHSCPVRPS